MLIWVPCIALHNQVHWFGLCCFEVMSWLGLSISGNDSTNTLRLVGLQAVACWGRCRLCYYIATACKSAFHGNEHTNGGGLFVFTTVSEESAAKRGATNAIFFKSQSDSNPFFRFSNMFWKIVNAKQFRLLCLCFSEKLTNNVCNDACKQHVHWCIV